MKDYRKTEGERVAVEELADGFPMWSRIYIEIGDRLQEVDFVTDLGDGHYEVSWTRWPDGSMIVWAGRHLVVKPANDYG